MNKNKVIKQLLYLLTTLICCSCTQNNIAQSTGDDVSKLAQREQESAGKSFNFGALVNKISFEVSADKKDYEDGIQPWVSIEKPMVDLPQLINKDETVIAHKSVTVIFDYPLNKQYAVEIKSSKGFTRKMLIMEISKIYHHIYNEEEKTATVKTLPIEKRTMYNRNETNGKFGIWGHDIGDLVLSGIDVHQTLKGQVVLTLSIES